MKIGLVGGIFGDPIERYAKSAPEKVLAQVLQRNGHEVITYPVASLPDADVDLYHVNHFGPATYYLALSKTRPLVFTPHDGFIISDYPHKASLVEEVLRKVVFRQADAVVALSQIEARVLREAYRIDSRKVAVIPNGLDLDLYRDSSRVENQQTSRKIKLLSVGQLEHFKGHRFLLEALSQVVPKFTEIELRIVTHNPRLLSDYERFCREHHLEDHVYFEGPKVTEELISYYSACDIYVQPSLVESFGVTALEAMACGRPVIATNVGGLGELIGDAGILVAPADSEALASAITFLMENPGARAQLSRQAQHRAREHYGDEKLYTSHIQMYEKVLESHSRKSFDLRVPKKVARELIWMYAHRSQFKHLVPKPILKRLS